MAWYTDEYGEPMETETATCLQCGASWVEPGEYHPVNDCEQSPCQSEFGAHSHDDKGWPAEQCAETLRNMVDSGDDGPDTGIGDQYYSGTGELVDDPSYIDYLNG